MTRRIEITDGIYATVEAEPDIGMVRFQISYASRGSSYRISAEAAEQFGDALVYVAAAAGGARQASEGQAHRERERSEVVCRS